MNGILKKCETELKKKRVEIEIFSEVLQRKTGIRKAREKRPKRRANGSTLSLVTPKKKKHART